MASKRPRNIHPALVRVDKAVETALSRAGLRRSDPNKVAAAADKTDWVAPGYSIGPSPENIALLRAKYSK